MSGPIPSIRKAHADLARLHTRKHSTAELADARALLTAAKVKQQIEITLDTGEPLSIEQREELAALILGNA
jgi:hypothetical protein